VVLAGQSAVALGSEEERARLLAAASAILLFRTPQPAELAALAGSERVAEGAWRVDGEELTGRQTITMRARARVDQDQVRQLPVGEADLIVRGLAERIRIVRTRIPGSVETVARGLTAPRPAGALRGNPAPTQGPGRAVASRVSGPPPPPQAPRRPSGPPASELDPPSSSPIRRYRPPGPGGEASPPDDRERGKPASPGGGEVIEEP
jgi:hypothetical protein